MLSNFSYPVICTDDYVRTVNFYEDYFDFSPEFELSKFSILKRADCDSSFIAVIDKNHEYIPREYQGTTKGMILHLPVQNIDSTYQQFYWEGLNIISEPVIGPDIGVKHFYIEDPNGILIAVAEVADYSKLDPFSIMDKLMTQQKNMPKNVRAACKA